MPFLAFLRSFALTSRFLSSPAKRKRKGIWHLLFHKHSQALLISQVSSDWLKTRVFNRSIRVKEITSKSHWKLRIIHVNNFTLRKTRVIMAWSWLILIRWATGVSLLTDGRMKVTEQNIPHNFWHSIKNLLYSIVTMNHILTRTSLLLSRCLGYLPTLPNQEVATPFHTPYRPAIEDTSCKIRPFPGVDAAWHPKQQLWRRVIWNVRWINMQNGLALFNTQTGCPVHLSTSSRT